MLLCFLWLKLSRRKAAPTARIRLNIRSHPCQSAVKSLLEIFYGQAGKVFGFRVGQVGAISSLGAKTLLDAQVVAETVRLVEKTGIAVGVLVGGKGGGRVGIEEVFDAESEGGAGQPTAPFRRQSIGQLHVP